MDDKGEKCKEEKDILVNELQTVEEEKATDKGSCSEENNSVGKSLNSSFQDDLSDDENICRSPQKSPVKKIQTSRGANCVLPSDEDFQFKKPKFRKKKFIFHPFVRNSDGVCVPDQDKEPVEVTIPEQLAASYGLYIWPSAPVLAWYIWLNQDQFVGKRILELGAGTALPGLLAAKLGAEKVILTDSLRLPHCIQNCEEGVQLNSLSAKVTVQPLTWGRFTSSTIKLRDSIDFVIGSDLFFDPEVFEPLIVTVSWLLDNNPGAKFVCTVQERAADWSIEALLLRWNLRCSVQQPKNFLLGTGINEEDLTGNHQIFLLHIWKK